MTIAQSNTGQWTGDSTCLRTGKACTWRGLLISEGSGKTSQTPQGLWGQAEAACAGPEGGQCRGATPRCLAILWKPEVSSLPVFWVSQDVALLRIFMRDSPSLWTEWAWTTYGSNSVIKPQLGCGIPNAQSRLGQQSGGRLFSRTQREPLWFRESRTRRP